MCSSSPTCQIRLTTPPPLCHDSDSKTGFTLSRSRQGLRCSPNWVSAQTSYSYGHTADTLASVNFVYREKVQPHGKDQPTILLLIFTNAGGNYAKFPPRTAVLFTFKSAKTATMFLHRLLEPPKTDSRPRKAQEYISIASSVLPKATYRMARFSAVFNAGI